MEWGRGGVGTVGLWVDQHGKNGGARIRCLGQILNPVPGSLASIQDAWICANYFIGIDPSSPIWASVALAGGRKIDSPCPG